MGKALRQQEILDLVRAGDVSSQEQLRALLQQRGFAVTQSTLSRDIKELELVKGPRGYQVAVDPMAGEREVALDRLRRALQQHLLRSQAAQNLVVLRTEAGNANPLALALDHVRWASVIGTVAGDDTVLIVTPDSDQARSLAQQIESLAR